VSENLAPKRHPRADPPRTHTAAALAGLAVALALAAAGWWAGRAARATGPLPQEGYVWQRNWPSQVVAESRQNGLTGVVVLAAEADLAHQPPRIAELAVTSAPAPDRRPAGIATRATTQPSAGIASRAAPPALGLALRIGPLPKPFAEAPQAADQVIALARHAVTRATAAGWRVSELQIDFDCASARLDDYAQLVARLRHTVAPVPVVITALPNWLARRAAFAHLAAATDGYVLQVHSLVRPASAASPLLLSDPVAARAAVDTAAGFHRPFRVALPTYGYTAAFAAAGRPFLGLWAEGPPVRWPPGTLLRTARSDPAAMAALVRAWTRDRPRQLIGILWYRLPAPQDRLNWTWPTLRAVMAGRPPRHDLRITQAPAAPGDPPALSQIQIANLGEADEPWPTPIHLRWSGATLLAADGLAGYQGRSPRPGEATLTWSPTPPPPNQPQAPRSPNPQDLPTLPPTARRLIGWLRFDRPTVVQVEAGAPPR
jgi:Protein of unknown function (DUF3142)